MNTCPCGNTADSPGTQCRRCAALQDLGLAPGATQGDIKAAYRAHVKAWHPDRFNEDKSQQRAAEQKMKAVNAAFKFLSSTTPGDNQQRNPPSTSTKGGQSECHRAETGPDRKSNQEPPTGNYERGASAKEHSGDKDGHEPSRASSTKQTGHDAKFNQNPPSRTPSRNLPKDVAAFLGLAIFICCFVGSRLIFSKPDTDASNRFKDDKANQQFQQDWERRDWEAKKASVDRAEELLKQKRYSEARSQMEEACQRDMTSYSDGLHACNDLGYLYAHGLGGNRDSQRAQDIYRKGCDEGYVESCNALR